MMVLFLQMSPGKNHFLLCKTLQDNENSYDSHMQVGETVMIVTCREVKQTWWSHAGRSNSHDGHMQGGQTVMIVTCREVKQS